MPFSSFKSGKTQAQGLNDLPKNAQLVKTGSIETALREEELGETEPTVRSTWLREPAPLRLRACLPAPWDAVERPGSRARPVLLIARALITDPLKSSFFSFLPAAHSPRGSILPCAFSSVLTGDTAFQKAQGGRGACGSRPGFQARLPGLGEAPCPRWPSPPHL